MKKLEMMMAVMVAGTVLGGVDCDLTRNPAARDGHTPPDATRYFQIAASKDYAANPSSVMLPDDKTILAFWDQHQCGPCGPAAVSTDAGRTWTRIDERIPKEFAACHDEPKAYRFVDKSGKARIRVFASYGMASYADWRGPADRPLAEAMPSILSEDDGKTWKYLPPLGADFACVVGFSGMVRLGDGAYLGVFCRGKNPNGAGGAWRVCGSFSRDGGLTWEKPFDLLSVVGKNLFVPTVFRSPDGKELCCLVGSLGGKEDAATYACYSSDEGKTWSEPRRVADDLDGIEHSVGVLADGRLLVAFHKGSQLNGWLGTWRAFRNGKDGVGVRLFHSYGSTFDSGSPNVHVRKDGEIVVVAHAQYTLRDPMPLVLAMRLRAEEIDRQMKERDTALHHFSDWKAFEGTSFKPLTKGKFHGPFSMDVVGKYKECEFKFTPWDGTKAYLTKTCGERFKEMNEKNGTYEIKKYQKHDMGDAAILTWTIQVDEDCTAKIRLIASPEARCLVGTKVVLPAVTATIFEPRTGDVSLKKGENELSVMVYHPRERSDRQTGLAGLPLRIGIGLDCPKGFKCLDPGRNLELKADADDFEMGLGDEL